MDQLRKLYDLEPGFRAQTAVSWREPKVFQYNASAQRGTGRQFSRKAGTSRPIEIEAATLLDPHPALMAVIYNDGVPDSEVQLTSLHVENAMLTPRNVRTPTSE